MSKFWLSREGEEYPLRGKDNVDGFWTDLQTPQFYYALLLVILRVRCVVGEPEAKQEGGSEGVHRGDRETEERPHGEQREERGLFGQ